jgi:glycosyltransferase involved in cell wall biosynthesis
MYAINASLYFGPLCRMAEPCICLLEGVLTSRMDGVLTVDSRGGWLSNRYRRWTREVQEIWNLPSLRDDPQKEVIDSLTPDYRNRKVVAFIGGLNVDKGLRVAIKAVSLIVRDYPDLLLLCMGPLRDDPKVISELVQESGVKDYVRFLDPMPYPEMLAHLSHARVGLALHQASRNFSLVSAGNGRKFFTYMQAALPIVGPIFYEIGKAVEIARCGVLVDTRKPEMVAEAVSRLLTNENEVVQMGRNGRQAFEKGLNWEVEQRKFIRFVSGITKSSSEAQSGCRC